MTTDRNITESQRAAKLRRPSKSELPKTKERGKKAPARQKIGMVEVISAAGEASKKSPRIISTIKSKAIRDNFKMPAADYALIAALKERALQSGRPVKKNELLRAGLRALVALDDTQLQQQLSRLKTAKSKSSVRKADKSSD